MIRNVLTSIVIAAMLCGCAGHLKWVKDDPTNSPGNAAYTCAPVRPTPPGAPLQPIAAPAPITSPDPAVVAAQKEAALASARAEALTKAIEDLRAQASANAAELAKMRSPTAVVLVPNDPRDLVMSQLGRASEIQQRLLAEKQEAMSKEVIKAFEANKIKVLGVEKVVENYTSYELYTLEYGGFTAKIRFTGDYSGVVGYWYQPRSSSDHDLVYTTVRQRNGGLDPAAWASFTQSFRYGETGTQPIDPAKPLADEITNKVAKPFRDKANTP